MCFRLKQYVVCPRLHSTQKPRVLLQPWSSNSWPTNCEQSMTCQILSHTDMTRLTQAAEAWIVVDWYIIPQLSTCSHSLTQELSTINMRLVRFCTGWSAVASVHRHFLSGPGEVEAGLCYVADVNFLMFSGYDGIKWLDNIMPHPLDHVRSDAISLYNLAVNHVDTW